MVKITVITADVIGSRDANLTQESMARKLRGLRHPDIISPFTVSRGDELQGVLTGWLPHPEIVRRLRWACLPLKLRIGIGLGIFQGELNPDPWKMSGQAFFRARQALDQIKSGREPATRLITGAAALNELANSGWLLMDTLLSGWTRGQWEAVTAYEEEGTYAAAGERLGVAAQNVQKRCKAARWNQIRRAERGLSSLGELMAAVYPDPGDKVKNTRERVER